MNYPPSGEDLREYLTAHNLNAFQVADLLHVSRRSVGYWMAGKIKMPYSIWHTLRVKVEHPEIMVTHKSED